MSHELRTPLTPVLATVSNLYSQECLPGEVREILDMMQRNIELETKLIDDLLDMSRLVRGKVELHPEIVNAHDCLRWAVEICESEIDAAHLHVSLHLHAAQHCVWADAARLQQVFWNLLKNAIKFTPAHGSINVRSSNQGGQIVVQISDSGIGIEAEMLPKVFNAFEQAEQTKARRFGGVGLGLTIAKNVADLLHGHLFASSEGKDKGATFTVELRTVAPAPEPKPPLPVSKNPEQPRRILLVDDSPDTLRILSLLLRKWGHSVTVADCVRTALEAAARERFDLLISDLGLPDGSGWDIMRHVKERYHLHGIAVSGFGTDEDVRESHKAGFEEHFIKPLNFQSLRASVQRIASEAA